RMHVMTIIAGWELHLDMELGQLQVACDLLQRYEGIDPAELLPPELPATPVTFEPNKDYVRQVLEAQVDLATVGLTYVRAADFPGDLRSRTYREVANAGGAASELVSSKNRTSRGGEYRDETEGPNPVPELQAT